MYVLDHKKRRLQTSSTHKEGQHAPLASGTVVQVADIVSVSYVRQLRCSRVALSCPQLFALSRFFCEAANLRKAVGFKRVRRLVHQRHALV
jgi:hypothetical protein